MSFKFKQFAWADEHFEELEVIEGKPRLYVTPTGEKLPSMTSVLSVLDDGGIEQWRERIGHEEADKITKEAADRGNALHDYNEEYLKNNLKRTDLQGQARVLFNRVKPYLDEIQLVIATEVPLYNLDDEYAGRVDCVGMLNDELTIIDHKNSRKPINVSHSFGLKKLFTYQIQCTGYGRALYKMKGYKPTKGCLIVGNHLTSNSNRFIFDLEPFERELDIIIHAYHNGGEGLEKSLYFKM